jgi:hypothetical protein
MTVKTTTRGKFKAGTPKWSVVSIELRDVNSNKQIGWIGYTEGESPHSDSCYVAERVCKSLTEWLLFAGFYME